MAAQRGAIGHSIAGRDVHPAVATLLARIEAEPGKLGELRVDVMARALGVSTFYLQHTIRRDLECSFTQLIRRRRVAYANRVLLEQPGRTIEEVAYACGYTPPMMYRHFRLELGMSPSDVRRNAVRTSWRQQGVASSSGGEGLRPLHGSTRPRR